MKKLWIRLVVLLPLTLFFIVSFSFQKLDGDWTFHLANNGELPYPDFTSIFFNLLDYILPRQISIFLVAITTFLILPFILIEKLSNTFIATLYIYASGIPFILFDGGFIPQGFIHVLMLASLYSNYFFYIFILLGDSIHREWLLGVLLILAYKAIKGFYGNHTFTNT